MIVRLKDTVSRTAEGVECSCGGYAKRVDLTAQEIKDQSCHRSYECCGRAFVCSICGNRLVGNAEAPEMR